MLSDATNGRLDVLLIGTGSEVSLCLGAQEALKKQGVEARVISMPSWKLFEDQDEAYRESVLPSTSERVSLWNKPQDSVGSGMSESMGRASA